MNKGDGIVIRCNDVTINRDKGFFVADEWNAIFEVNFSTDIYRVLSSFPEGHIRDFRINQICVRYRDELFCFPDQGDGIWCFHLEKKEIKKIIINNPLKRRITTFRAILIEDKIYALFYGWKKIIEFNPEAKKIEGEYEYYDQAEISFTGQDFLNIKDKIYITLRNANQIIEFDVKSKDVKYYNLHSEVRGIETISYCNGLFYISECGRGIYCWEKDSNTINKIGIVPRECGYCLFDINEGKKEINYDNFPLNDNFFFYRSVVVQDKIWFIPLRASRLIYMDIKTSEIKCLDNLKEYEELEKVKREHWYQLQYVLEERYIGLYLSNLNETIEIDAKTLNVRKRNFTFCEEYEEKISNQLYSNNTIIHEDDVHGIRGFLSYIGLFNYSRENSFNNI